MGAMRKSVEGMQDCRGKERRTLITNPKELMYEVMEERDEVVRDMDSCPSYSTLTACKIENFLEEVLSSAVYTVCMRDVKPDH